MAGKDREDMLNEKWSSILPCESCCIREICKYNNVIKRVDFPEDIFTVSISCKIQRKYREVNKFDTI